MVRSYSTLGFAWTMLFAFAGCKGFQPALDSSADMATDQIVQVDLGKPDGPEKDRSVDGSSDARLDSEIGSDAQPDSGTDSGPDAPSDSGQPDNGPDAPSDTAHDSDPSDIGVDNGPQPDIGADSGPQPDFAAGGPCRQLALPCLDPSDPKVIDLPTETTSLSDAFAAAAAGDTIQIRGLKVGSVAWMPPNLTLRGCQGAEIIGAVLFQGSGGTIEGFTVSGEIIASRTGNFIIRYNHFVGASASAAVAANANEAMTSAAVRAIVDSNLFDGRSTGIRVATDWATYTHSVDITIRNNIFKNVDRPIVIDEGGMVGKVDARIEHNTIHGFSTALEFSSLSTTPVIAGMLLSSGNQAILANGAFYELQHSLLWQVTTTHDTAPLSGAFITGNPAYVDAASGDFRLEAGSAALDVIAPSASMPSVDYYGCPRPVAVVSATAMGDIGALETQIP